MPIDSSATFVLVLALFLVLLIPVSIGSRNARKILKVYGLQVQWYRVIGAGKLLKTEDNSTVKVLNIYKEFRFSLAEPKLPYKSFYNFEYICESRKEYETVSFDLLKSEFFSDIAEELVKTRKVMRDRYRKRASYLSELNAIASSSSLSKFDAYLVDIVSRELKSFPIKPILVSIEVSYVSPGGRVNISKEEDYTISLKDDLKQYIPATVEGSKLRPGAVNFFRSENDLNMPGVYVYTYPSFVRDGAYPVKIGMTENQTIVKRVRDQERDGAGIPERAVILAAIPTRTPGELERRLHVTYRKSKTVGGGREWFRVPAESLILDLMSLDLQVAWNKEIYSKHFDEMRRDQQPASVSSAPKMVPAVAPSKDLSQEIVPSKIVKSEEVSASAKGSIGRLSGPPPLLKNL